MRPDWTYLIWDAKERSCKLCGHSISQIYIDVLSMTKQPVLSNTIRKCRLQWFGHLQCMDNHQIPRRLYQWTPTHGKRRFGCSRTTWKNVIQMDLRRLGTEWSTKEVEAAAQDRSVWKYLSSQAACAELHKADW